MEGPSTIEFNEDVWLHSTVLYAPGMHWAFFCAALRFEFLIPGLVILQFRQTTLQIRALVQFYLIC